MVNEKMQNNITHYYMKKNINYSKLSKDELIKLLEQKDKKLMEQNVKPVPKRKSVKQQKQKIPLPPEIKPILPIKKTKKKKRSTEHKIKIVEKEHALEKFTRSFEIDIENRNDPEIQLNDTRAAMRIKIIGLLIQMRGLKFVETMKVTFKKETNLGMVEKTAYFNSYAQTIINTEEIDEALDTTKQEILNRINIWTSEGSGWTIKSVDNHNLNVLIYAPLEGSSYVKLPKELNNSSKGLINIQNKDDNECFRWCHIRHLNPQEKDAQRIKKSDREMVNTLDYSGIEFPVAVKHYNKIEVQNKIRVNVFGYENGEKYPIFISKEKYDDCLNLLLINKFPDDERVPMVDIDKRKKKIQSEAQHYVLIKDFNSFMYDYSKHKERKHFCLTCPHSFTTKRLLDEHRDNCILINGTQAIRMPKDGENILKFNNHHKQLPVPFVIYADFEAIVEKVHGCRPNIDSSYTEAYQKHTDCGYAYKLVCCYDDQYSKPVKQFRGRGSVREFMNAMLDEVKYCGNTVDGLIKKYSNIDNCDRANAKRTEDCCMCGNKFIKKEKGQYYCQMTGKCRGTAHKECVSKIQIDPRKLKIPVVFHNLRGYDSHFIMQKIGGIVSKNMYLKDGKEIRMNINVIPNNQEKYMAFMLGDHLNFID